MTNVIQVGGNIKYVAIATFSNLPPASNYPIGTSAFATDIGINGSEMVVSTSGAWVPNNGRTLLTRLTLPLVKAPTFTGTTNGAITLGTATGSIYAKCYMYFPANSLVAAHAAGWYYTEMSSTTAGVVYNNTYTPAAGVFPTEPTSKTAFSGAVPGGAGSSSEVTAFTFSVPANVLGSYGIVKMQGSTSWNSTAGNKNFRLRANSTSVSAYDVKTSVGAKLLFQFGNSGDTNRNYTTSSPASNLATDHIRTTIDTTSAVTMALSMQCAVATDVEAIVFFDASIEVA